MSWSNRNINLGDTAEEKRAKAERQRWMNRVQWRMFKGCVLPNDWKEFQRLYSAMKESGDESELTAWITKMNAR
jgi:CRISPR/Cas system-associated endoribonuclease Cas2